MQRPYELNTQSQMGRGGLSRRAWWFHYITQTCRDPDLWWNIPVWKIRHHWSEQRSDVIRIDDPYKRVHRNVDIIRYLTSLTKVNGKVPLVFCPVENKYRTPRYLVDDILREILREFIKVQNRFTGPSRIEYRVHSNYHGCNYCCDEGIHREKVRQWLKTMGIETGWWSLNGIQSGPKIYINFDAHRFAKIRLRRLYDERILMIFMCCNRIGLKIPRDVRRMITSFLIML